MTEKISLKAQIRTKEDGKTKKIRSQNFIPAILYGLKLNNQNLKIKKMDFEQIFNLAGESRLIDLVIDNKSPVKILIKDIQKDLIKDNIIHADLYRVDMNKKITTEIPLNFIGESPAVKELGGILIKDMNSIEIECLPGDLINEIKIDLSTLKNIHDTIRLDDLKLPNSIKLINKTNNTITSIVEPRIEEEEEEEKPVEGEEVGEKEGEEAEKKAEESKEKKVGEDKQEMGSKKK